MLKTSFRTKLLRQVFMGFLKSILCGGVVCVCVNKKMEHLHGKTFVSTATTTTKSKSEKKTT